MILDLAIDFHCDADNCNIDSTATVIEDLGDLVVLVTECCSDEIQLEATEFDEFLY